MSNTIKRRTVASTEIEGVELDFTHIPIDEIQFQKVLNDGSIIVGYLAHDDDCENPCESCDGVGSMRSLNSRHINHIAYDEALEMLESDKMVVPLSYYEHGLCLWDVVSGPRIAGCPDKQWDQVSFAGIWIPDQCCRDEIKHRSKTRKVTYQEVARELAAECCKTYTEWANGACYGIVTEKFSKEGEPVGNADSCWGFIGHEHALQSLKDAFDAAI